MNTPETSELLSRLRAHQPITADESYALASLLQQAAHAHRYIQEHGAEHPIEAVLWRGIRDVYLRETVLSGSAPSSTEDTTPPVREPRVWQQGDAEPDDTVRALATSSPIWPFLIRAGGGGWFFSSSTDPGDPLAKGCLWEWALSEARGPLTEVLPLSGPGSGS